MVRLDNEQVFAYNPATGRVVALQMWSGLHRGKHGFVMVVNGQVMTNHPGSKAAVHKWFTAAGSQIPKQHLVTAEEAMERLRTITNDADRSCVEGSCGAVLPMGGLWCTECGAPQRKA